MRLPDVFFPPSCVFCGKALPCPCAAEAERLRSERAAPFMYRGVVAKALKGLKFHNRLGCVRYFARAIYDFLPDKDFDAVTCVPLSARRGFKRGYNQSELLARDLAKLLGVPFKRTLRRARHSAAQSLSDDEARRENVAGAYRALRGLRAEGVSVLLVDDIITTGATIGECAKVLEAAGARVTCVAAARSR
ncbi:hypothetical protein FACS18949_00270 [Clostridia bacterium]|nr:hypothetical protein FACS18949_00270 [Clostridia bacterium]